MVDLHQVLGMLVLAMCAGAGLLGLIAYARRRTPGGVARHLLALVQTVLVAQVAVGLLLLSDGRRTGDDLHYAYGSLALVAVLAPWMYAPAEPRPRLAWFSGATLLAGALAVRAYTTAG
jgi:hypothetical protein